jgi:hypothetical protein
MEARLVTRAGKVEGFGDLGARSFGPAIEPDLADQFFGSAQLHRFRTSAVDEFDAAVAAEELYAVVRLVEHRGEKCVIVGLNRPRRGHACISSHCADRAAQISSSMNVIIKQP